MRDINEIDIRYCRFRRNARYFCDGFLYMSTTERMTTTIRSTATVRFWQATGSSKMRPFSSAITSYHCLSWSWRTTSMRTTWYTRKWRIATRIWSRSLYLSDAIARVRDCSLRLTSNLMVSIGVVIAVQVIVDAIGTVVEPSSEDLGVGSEGHRLLERTRLDWKGCA